MKKTVAIFAVLFAVALVSARAEDFDAKAAYDGKCAMCHGKDGKGDTAMGKKGGVKDYSKAEIQAKCSDEQALKSLKDGMKEGDAVKMKPFGEKFSETELKAIIKYFRTLAK